MKYALLIALREFTENAKTKGFWIGIFMLPLIIGVSIAVSNQLSKAEPSRYFVVVDPSGDFADSVASSTNWAHQRQVLRELDDYARTNLRPGESHELPLWDEPANVDRFIAAGGKDAYLARLQPLLRENAPAFREPTRLFVRADLPAGIDTNAGTDDILAALRPYLLGDRKIVVDGTEAPLFAALVFAPDAMQALLVGTADESTIQYWSTNLAVNDLPNIIRGGLDFDVRRRLYVARGVDFDTVREVEARHVPVGTFDPGKAAGAETVSTADRIVRNVPVALVYILWMSIFTVMQLLLNNTIEEKSNRIAEVLLSSVTPGEIMMGKLIGIGGIGLTMVVVWFLTVYVGVQLYQGAGADVIGPALDAVMSSGLIPMFVLCFVLGYLIYAGMFLAIGALCSDLKQAQNAQGPLMLVMMVPLFTMMFVNRDPHGTVATILTWIPLYTPFTMMNRAAADPPALEVVGATALMIVTALLFLWSAGRIFRIALLRAGNRPTLADVLRWLRRAES